MSEVQKMKARALLQGARYMDALESVFVARYGEKFNRHDPGHRAAANRADFKAAVEKRFALMFGEKP